MSDVEAIFSELLDQRPSAAAMTEANDRTIPGGTYKFEIVKATLESASEKSPWPGRGMVRVTANAMYKNGDGTFKSKGRINFDMSFQEMKNEKTNRLDTQSKLWLNLLAVVGKTATHREALEYLEHYPLTATVSRTFKTLDGKWVTPKTDEETERLLNEGAEPRNFVQGLRAFSG